MPTDLTPFILSYMFSTALFKGKCLLGVGDHQFPAVIVQTIEEFIEQEGVIASCCGLF